VSFRLHIDIPLTPQHRESLALANRALDHLRLARRKRIIARSSPGLASWALDSLIQYGLHRIVTLATGMSAEWNKKRLLNCIVLARSLMETVGAWFRVLDDTYKLLPDEDIRRIHSLLNVAMFGRRDLTEGDNTLPPAVNAITGIKRLDKLCAGTLAMYEGICEYVHPNSDGYLMFGRHNLETGDAELGEQFAFERASAVSIATVSARYLRLADDFVQKYESVFKAQVEALDRKFGEKVDSWPGDPKDVWMPSEEGV